MTFYTKGNNDHYDSTHMRNSKITSYNWWQSTAKVNNETRFAKAVLLFERGTQWQMSLRILFFPILFYDTVSNLGSSINSELKRIWEQRVVA